METIWLGRRMEERLKSFLRVEVLGTENNKWEASGYRGGRREQQAELLEEMEKRAKTTRFGEWYVHAMLDDRSISYTKQVVMC